MKKLLFACLAALVLTGCVKDESPSETTPESTETTPDTQAETTPESDETILDSSEPAPAPTAKTTPAAAGNPLKYDLDSIPEGAEYFTICRHKYQRSGIYRFKSDALLEEYQAEELENVCYYIPVGDEPDIAAYTYEGDAFVFRDGGMRLVTADGLNIVLPDEFEKTGLTHIVRDEVSGEITGVVMEEGVDFSDKNRDDNAVLKDYYYSIAAGRITCVAEETDYIDYSSYNGLITVRRQVHGDDEANEHVTLVVDGDTGESLHAFIGDAAIIGNKSEIYYTVRNKGCSFFDRYGEIYNSDFEEIARSKSRYSSISVTPEGYVVLVKGGEEDPETGEKEPVRTYTVIDWEGNEIYKSPEYSSVLCTVDGYAYVHEWDEINLYKWNGGHVQTLVKLGSLDEVDYSIPLYGSYRSEYVISAMYDEEIYGYYKNVGTEYEPEYALQEGQRTVDPCVFITVADVQCASLPGDAAEFVYIPSTGESGVIAYTHSAYAEKPVLYLYPEDECGVSVTFAHPERLMTVYPGYNNATGWNVTAQPDGTLTDSAGRNYYALYWDESGAITPDWNEGFSVKREDASSFLEEKLAEIGLTWREANEFIMYWLPYFEKNEYTLVWFEFTESREAENKLHITPEPDSLLRFSIHLKGSDADVDLAEQVIPTFERSGFTAVEWGGVYHE